MGELCQGPTSSEWAFLDANFITLYRETDTMNFAESLVYWYLRLNGFFPITDFVLHATREPRSRYSADCDLLAIRPAGVGEAIGGRLEDWDSRRFEEWGADPSRDAVTLMVEVKSGTCATAAAAKAFGDMRCRMALERTGHANIASAEDLLNQFCSAKSVRTRTGIVAKVLVAEKRRPRKDDRWFSMTLTEVDHFLVRRMEHYQEKYSDRMFFPDALAQYMAWKHGGRGGQVGGGRRQSG
jgi:hypothetical protein